MTGPRAATRTDRLTEIERLLFDSAIGMRAIDIAKECNVDRRTIYRDLAMLGEIGIPIHQKDGRFYIDREQYTAPTKLTFDEAMALFLASRVASRFQDQHNPHMISALEKIGKALPKSIETHVETICRNESEETLDLVYTSVLDLVTRAWSEHRKIHLFRDNTRDAKPIARDFAIYMIEPNAEGYLCLIGFDGATQSVRPIRLSDIRRAKITTTTYTIPPQFDASRYLMSDWTDLTDEARDDAVILLFAPHVASRLYEQPWPTHDPRDYVERLPDDSIQATLYVTQLHEIMPWIRSWGADVEVLAPADLRERFAQEAALIEARYRPQSARGLRHSTGR